MSAAALMRAAGFTRPADVYELERVKEKQRRPRIDRVVRVARALQVTTDWLTGVGPDAVPEPTGEVLAEPKPEVAA